MAKYRTIEQIRDALQCTDESGLNAEACYELGENIDSILRERDQAQPVSVPIVKAMVDRFLSWRLPKPWRPDNGISYTRPNYAHPESDKDWPTGTNLFDADQAEQMIRYMLAASPASTANSDDARDAERWRHVRNNTGDGLRIITWDHTKPTDEGDITFHAPILCDKYTDDAIASSKDNGHG